jgi:hypothetical protein|tara:strand:- start:1729 stop:2358 length:630 start_codon:yes stop_codon:yes gene_type:complete
MANITKITENYIKNHPSIKQSIKNNIINYSKLARKISKEKNIKSIDAILIACRRYNDKLKKTIHQLPLIELLKKSKLSIRNKIVVVILEPDISFKSILDIQKEVDEKNEIVRVIRGANGTTLITTEDFLDKIEKTFKQSILKTSKDLVEVMLKSSSRLESVPGVTGYIYSLFGEHDINILETISCWTDTILIIKNEDLPKAMDLLSFNF